VRWVGEFPDGSIANVGPGHPFEGVVAISCDDYRVEVPEGAKLMRLERTSIGKHSWHVGIIAIDDTLHIVGENGSVMWQQGWGTDVLTGAPCPP